MRRQTDPMLEDDSALFGPPFTWLVPKSEREDCEAVDDELGFRALLEDPEMLLNTRASSGVRRRHSA